MKAWKLAVAAVVIGLAMVILLSALQTARLDRLAQMAKPYADFVSDEAIRRSLFVHSYRDDGSTEYVHYWSAPDLSVLYVAYVWVDEDGARELTLRRLELPKGDKTSRHNALAILIGTVLGRLEIVREERFTDEYSDGKVNFYRSYAKSDGTPFDARDRDVGERAGVILNDGGNDRQGRQARYNEVLKEARRCLEEMREKK